MRPSRMYQMDLDRQQAERAIPQRIRDDESGFAGQAGWGSAAVEKTVEFMTDAARTVAISIIYED